MGQLWQTIASIWAWAVLIMTMLPFRNGPFRLAIETGTPILRLAVYGTGTALPKHGWRFGRSRAEVRVLEPIETVGLTIKDMSALKERVRGVIAAAHAELTGTAVISEATAV